MTTNCIKEQEISHTQLYFQQGRERSYLIAVSAGTAEPSEETANLTTAPPPRPSNQNPEAGVRDGDLERHLRPQTVQLV